MLKPIYFHHEDDPAQININGSETNKNLVLVPPGDHWYQVPKLVISISDSANDVNQFGALAALPNGLKFVIDRKKPGKDPVVWQQLFADGNGNGQVFKNTQDLNGIGKLERLTDAATAVRTVKITIDLEDIPFDVYGRQYQRLAVQLNDDFTGLDEFNILAYVKDLPYG